MRHQKSCVVCACEFITTKSRTVCCSDECKRVRHLERLRQSRGAQTHHKTCTECGEQFTTRHPGTLTCSKECSDARGRRRQSIGAQEEDCQWCGKAFVPMYRKWKGYCSGLCRKAGQYVNRGSALQSNVEEHRRSQSTPVRYGDCVQCGERMVKRGCRKTCSEQCAYKRALEQSIAASKEKYVPASKHRRQCFECGQRFLGIKNQRYCSTACCDKAHARQHNAHRRLRIRKQSPSGIRPIGLYEIARRDEFKCKICGLAVDLSIKHRGRMSPTLDHIVPISNGGTHTRDNVQLAHMACNSIKGAMPNDEVDKDALLVRLAGIESAVA